MAVTNEIDIKIKGIREGLLVTIRDGDWNEIQASLLTQIKEKEAFFKGAKLALDVGIREIRAAELSVIRDRLSEQNVSLWAVLSSSLITERNAQVLGLATKISSPKPERTIKRNDGTLPGENAVFVNRTIRSGFKVLSHDNVVVMGDVNPGGEIVAGGSIVIWGKCRGSVHAGADGDENAVICALELSPLQLRIAEHIGELQKKVKSRKAKTKPELVKLVDGQVVSEKWN